MATHPSILAWEIPWTEKPDRLQSMGSQRAGHDLATKEQQALACFLHTGCILEVAPNGSQSSSVFRAAWPCGCGVGNPPAPCSLLRGYRW